ncbi:MAG TPA: ABC transporter ATP-binding protein, partial [Deinococcales bacterium]|nr:ABC transporter ATP-binding protein [Deinococcales bacterium]
PNGAGKTTAISLMLGLRRPTSGKALVFGRDPREPANRARLGAMLQESGVPATLKVREIVELASRTYARPLPVAQALEMADLTGKANALCSTLSGGQKQRLYFALSVCGDPDVLFLDEPSVALDVESRRAFWEQVGGFARRGKTIILTTHYLEEADALAERIVVINRGSIVASGTPAEIKARVGGKRLKFRSPEADPHVLKAVPGVQRVSVTNDAADIYTLEPERVLRELYKRDYQFSDLEVAGAGLEEAFVEITAAA